MPKLNTGTIQEISRKLTSGKIKTVLQARYQFTDDTGKRREKLKDVTTRTDGKKWLKDIAREHENKKSDFGKKEIRFLEFTNEIEPTLRKRKSVETMLIQLNFLRRYFGKMKLTDISYQSLEGYREWRKANPIEFKFKESRIVSDATIAKEFGLLSKIFTIAKEKKYLTVSPFALGGMLVSPKSEERDATMTHAEEKRLLEACRATDKYGYDRAHLYPVLVFAIDTTCRRGEILKLEWRDIDFARQIISIRKETTKTGDGREIPMSARLMMILEKHQLEKAKPNDFVFPVGDFKKSYKKVLTMAGLENFTFHDLRHVAISRLLEKGFPHALAMKISGHKQMTTFLRYVNPTTESLVEIMRRSEAATL